VNGSVFFSNYKEEILKRWFIDSRMGKIQANCIRRCMKVQKEENETIEANQKMDDLFNDSGSRNTIGDSENETANDKIQEQFYGNTKTVNSLPFHVDINNPPIKK
jgi:hypothetical protein